MYNQLFSPQRNLSQMNYPQSIQQPIVPQSNMNWIPVNGIQSVREYIVQPNEKLWFMDNNEPIFYVKIGDSLGKASIEAYMFDKVNLNDIEPRYITAAEFEEFKKAVMSNKKEND